ncbi:MAG: hypothetical protein EZS28_030496 [Streblomastix strix]|uniref:Uncharacterized protein n=1 Tax=Streblomastix strix TaxID=222440 RepID=A0A5J4UU93_9EUKA|nr:MAG: hypothetical protein EZS28_030496 [Streblomastix strix]
MSFASSDYLKRLANAQHSDYINSYSQFQEVMQTQTIVAQSFNISKQQFYDQPVTQLTNDGAHYTRAPLGARGLSTCSCVQTCQISWQIQIPANTLAIQVNEIKNNGTAVWNDHQTATMQSGNEATQQDYDDTDGTGEHIKFWLETMGYINLCERVSNHRIKLLDQ